MQRKHQHNLLLGCSELIYSCLLIQNLVCYKQHYHLATVIFHLIWYHTKFSCISIPGSLSTNPLKCYVIFWKCSKSRNEIDVKGFACLVVILLFVGQSQSPLYSHTVTDKAPEVPQRCCLQSCLCGMKLIITPIPLAPTLKLHEQHWISCSFSCFREGLSDARCFPITTKSVIHPLSYSCVTSPFRTYFI